MQDVERKKSIAEISTDTRILIQKIESSLIKEQQEIVTYNELSAVIGRDVRDVDYLLRTARKHVEKNNNVLIDVVFGQGIKLTKDYSGNLQKTTDKIRRRSKRQLSRTLRAVSEDKAVNPEELTEINTQVSILGVINEFTKPKSVKKIKGKVEAN